jgi:hypothetical protein
MWYKSHLYQPQNLQAAEKQKKIGCPMFKKKPKKESGINSTE